MLIGDFPGIDIVLPRAGSSGARGVGPGGVGTAVPISNTRAYPQSPYGVHRIYLESTTVRSTTVLSRYMYAPHRGAALAVRDLRGRPFDTFGLRMTAASEVYFV